MHARDVMAFSWRALRGYRLRSTLMVVAMAIGVAAVVVLTALGDGARRYVTGEFAALGTNLIIVLPGRTETTGGTPPLLAETPRDLTIEDALAMERSPAVRRVAPIVLGAVPVSWGHREREATVFGSTTALFAIRHLQMAVGSFLPDIDPRRGAPVCVLGAKIKRELLGNESPLGQWVRIGDRRYRVIGVLESEGRSLGIDLQEMVVIPVASAMALYNTRSLFRVIVEARSTLDIAPAKDDITRIVAARHDGEDDITVIAQDALLSTFDRIFTALTLAVGGIAAISLAVAGILIMNVMLVSVTQRTAEIGLLKALGATGARIQVFFLVEAAMQSILGAAAGVALGYAGTAVVRQVYPALPAAPPWWAVLAAIATAIGCGLAFALLPSRRAARLDPVAALARR
ncbi:MAG: ABC transporter permease [Candidatus Schekmanbacteria bacterium]|nr:ABC transporter permease [Candidatus Schekmanbacteria bacterium]